MSISQIPKPACLGCRYFNNAPSVLEQAIPGLRVMGSGYSSVVSSDGLCEKLDRYLSSSYWCNEYSPIEMST